MKLSTISILSILYLFIVTGLDIYTVTSPAVVTGHNISTIILSLNASANTRAGLPARDSVSGSLPSSTRQEAVSLQPLRAENISGVLPPASCNENIRWCDDPLQRATHQLHRAPGFLHQEPHHVSMISHSSGVYGSYSLAGPVIIGSLGTNQQPLINLLIYSLKDI